MAFPDAVELATQYVATTGNISKTETAAIKVVGLDVDATTVAEVASNTQMTLYVKYTKGTEDGIKIKFYDGYKADPGVLSSGDWYQEVVEADTNGVATLYAFEVDLTATATIAYHIPIGAVRAFLVSVQAYGAGATSGTLTLTLGFRTN